MEPIRRKQKAPPKSPVSRQLGFTITDRTNHNPETEVTEVAFLNRALKEAAEQGASHIHIEPADNGVAVRYRVDGEYREAARETRDVSAVMKRLRVLAGLPVVPPLGQEWGVIELQNNGKTHLFGTQMLSSVTGEKAVLQVLRESHMDRRRLDELGMLDDQLATLKSALEQRSGLIVLCGPPGSGMETTAYASLLRLDRKARSVATIELVARGQVPGVHQMEAGDVNEKNAMLRAVMRTDTDVVYVRDLTGVESAALALSAASEHNKLVIATLYSSCAAAALMHFVKLGIEPWLVGSGIALIQAQRLLPRLCPECQENTMARETPPDDERVGEEKPKSLISHQGSECEKCDGLGYKDEKILVCESLPFSGHMQQWLIEKASESEVQAAAVQKGMTTLRSMALGLAREGLISIDQVYLHTPPE
jgi:type II secretory ATPase GspE/PulE/Tfp pilus assembly ATPase PilB-like protein